MTFQKIKAIINSQQIRIETFKTQKNCGPKFMVEQCLQKNYGYLKFTVDQNDKKIMAVYANRFQQTIARKKNMGI